MVGSITGLTIAGVCFQAKKSMTSFTTRAASCGIFLYLCQHEHSSPHPLTAWPSENNVTDTHIVPGKGQVGWLSLGPCQPSRLKQTLYDLIESELGDMVLQKLITTGSLAY